MYDDEIGKKFDGIVFTILGTAMLIFGILLLCFWLTGCATVRPEVSANDVLAEATQTSQRMDREDASAEAKARRSESEKAEATPAPAPMKRKVELKLVTRVPPPERVVIHETPRPAPKPIATVSAPPPRIMRAPPERTMPCYLHNLPSPWPIERTVIFENQMGGFPVGLRWDGIPLQIVGMTADVFAVAPPGVAVAGLPPGERCYLMLDDNRLLGYHHWEASQTTPGLYGGKPGEIRTSQRFEKHLLGDDFVHLWVNHSMIWTRH